MLSVDIEDLLALEKRGLISKQEHPELPLLIWNYTNKCQYEGAWDDNTMMCRGLITDENGNIVARPFPKFFNLSEHEQKPSLPDINWKQDFYVTEKYDGSLGIAYRAPDEWCLATRGSFTSDQAIEGTKMLQKLDMSYIPDGYTPLFEIIYPENRIVVDYGETRELVLLDVLAHDGTSYFFNELVSPFAFAKKIGCRFAETYSMAPSDIKGISGNNREGIVVRFQDGMRVKVKIEEYVRLHRLITGTNARHIWEVLKSGGTIVEFIDRVPDEYYDWVEKISKELYENFLEIHLDSKRLFISFAPFLLKHGIGEGNERKLFAQYAKGTKYPHLLFKLYDGKDISQDIWKMIKPEYSVPFKDEI